VDAVIKESRWITASETALTVGINYGSAFAIIHDLSHHKVCARWAP
jgi:ribosomal protein S25